MSLVLHTPLELEAPALLARAAAATRKGGTLLTVSHYTLPPWGWDPDTTDGLLSAAELVPALGLHEPDWRTLLAAEMPRTVTDRDGHAGTVLDAVLHAVRATAPQDGSGLPRPLATLSDLRAGRGAGHMKVRRRAVT